MSRCTAEDEARTMARALGMMATAAQILRKPVLDLEERYVRLCGEICVFPGDGPYYVDVPVSIEIDFPCGGHWHVDVDRTISKVACCRAIASLRRIGIINGEPL